MALFEPQNTVVKGVMPSTMASHKKRVMEAIEESEGGINTINVSRRAGICRTTAIKYLYELKSEGKCEYDKVGPCKLWKIKTNDADIHYNIPGYSKDYVDGILRHISTHALFGDLSDDVIISLSFSVQPDMKDAILDLEKLK